MGNNDQKRATLSIVFAYIIWGMLPIYWKWLEAVPSSEVLAHRMIWAFIFMLLFVYVRKQWRPFIRTCKQLFKEKKKLLLLFIASAIISVNWFTYIWAVNHAFVVQASLGYYINPLVSILLGIIVLKERLSRLQIASFGIAAFGVIFLTVNLGVFPWISFILAFSFAIYGLIKKVINVDPIFGLTIETIMITPVAIIYLLMQPTNVVASEGIFSLHFLLFIGAGVATAVPLILFNAGAPHLPLSTLGFLQYIAPTLMLLIGVLMYKEPFTTAHLVAFIFIWTALIIYMQKEHSGRRKRSKQPTPKRAS